MVSPKKHDQLHPKEEIKLYCNDRKIATCVTGYVSSHNKHECTEVKHECTEVKHECTELKDAAEKFS